MPDPHRPPIHPFTILVIIVGFILGALVSLLSVLTSPGSAGQILLLSVGSGIISTALISLVLDLFWSRERARAHRRHCGKGTLASILLTEPARSL